MVQTPMDSEAFFGTFLTYHESFFAAPFVWNALAVVVIFLAARARGRADRMIGLFLAVLWAWAGVAYLILNHAPANPAAYAFGGLFVAQALVFLHLGVIRHRLTFEPGRNAFGITGGILMGYALVLYPLIGMALGHAYPATPTFGVPCPTTIFTFGILLWASSRVPGWALIIPAVWALIGSVAALNWGVWQDLAMPAAAVLASALLVARNRKHPVTEAERNERAEIAALAGVG